MAPLPSLAVTGNLKEILGDVAGDELVESVLSRARATFVSNVPPDTFVRWEGKLKRITVVEARFDDDGNLVTPDGDQVRLLAQSDGLNVRNLQWQCQIRILSSALPPLPAGRMRSFWFNATADDTTVALSNVIPAVALPIANPIPGALSPTEIQNIVDGAVDDLVDGAPAELDTLKQLAQAIDNDPNFLRKSRASSEWIARDSGHHVPGARTFWGDKPDSGTVSLFEDTDQPVFQTNTSGTTSRIRDGLLTLSPPASGNSGFYRQFNAGVPVTRVGARFNMGAVSGVTRQGGICLAAANGAVDTSNPAMVIPVHWSINADSWALSVVTNDPVFDLDFIDIVNFDVPLDVSGNTVYEAEFYLDGDTITLVAPDGNVHRYTDSRFVDLAGNWGFVESVVVNSASDNIPGFLEHWWDVGPQVLPKKNPTALGMASAAAAAKWSAEHPGTPVAAGRVDFRTKAASTVPSIMDTGQALSVTNTGGGGSAPVVVVGSGIQLARGTGDGLANCYYNLTTGGALMNRVGARWRLGPASGTGTWTVALALANGASVGAGGTAYRIGARLEMTRTGFTLSRVTNASGSLVATTLVDLDGNPVSGSWRYPLAEDTVQTLNAEMWISGNIGLVHLPDGQFVYFTDANLSTWVTSYGYVQQGMTHRATDSAPIITEMWHGKDVLAIPTTGPVVTGDALANYLTSDDLAAADVDSAGRLATPRAIDGVPFDGQADIGTGIWTPADNGLIAWTFDPAIVLSGSGQIAGYLFVAAIKIPRPRTVTNLLMNVQTAGSGLTAGQCKAALYQSGTLKAATADQATAWASLGLKTMALTTPQSVTAGLAYVAWWVKGTTPPLFSSAAGALDPTTLVAFNAGGVTRFGYDTTTGALTTTAPASLGALSGYNCPIWAAVS